MMRLLLPLLALATVSSAQIESVPLAPRSQPDGTTLFTTLVPARTGIVTTNNYDDPRMWAEFYRELTFGGMGTGVAIGDYDGDGRPDVFVVSKTETSRLFRNLGDWRFEDVTTRAGLPLNEGEPGEKDWEQGASFADIDNDGDLDLYVCRYAAPNLLYLNRGDGTFREEAAARGLDIVDGSGVGTFCDYDGDGWLDVYVLTNMMDYVNNPDGRRDYLLRNRGDGTFEDVTVRAGISGVTAGHSATWCDFDADGHPDIWVANDFATPDRYYHNNGDGTFTNIINDAVPHMSHYSMGADFADVNNDGRFDLLVADMATTSHEKDQRSMAGSRVRGQKIDETSPVPPQYMRNALHLNAGNGRFREAAVLAGLRATDWTWSPRFEDYDNDGRVDLTVTNGMNREYHGADLLERIMISENPGAPIRIMLDSPVLEEANLAFRNEGDLRFSQISTEWGFARNGVSFGSATGDLDGDGDLDLVHGNYQGPPSVYRNDSTSGHRITLALQGTASNRRGVGAIVRLRTADGQEQVRQLIPNRGYLSTSQPLVHFGLGEQEHIAELVVQWPSGYEQRFTDLAADRHYTVTEAGDTPVTPPSNPVPLFREVAATHGMDLPGAERIVDEPNGQPLLPFRFNRPGPLVTVGNLNGDAHPDLVVSGTSMESPRILIGTGSDRFNSVAAPPLAGDSRLPMGPVLLFDSDGDGRDDLLVTRTGANTRLRDTAYQPTLFLNRGGFSPAPEGTLPDLPISVGAVVAADWDGDGDDDLFIGGRIAPGAYPSAPRSAMLRNDGGTFVDITPEPLSRTGMVTAAQAVDLDGDGQLDLVLMTDWGTVQWWRNDGGEWIDASVTSGFDAAGTGWWRSLAVADFNGDGRLDVAAGNVGLNTYYGDGPAVAILGNFSGRRRGSPTLVEAYYEAGKLFPRRERKDLTGQVRALQRKYRFTVDYADQTIDALFDAEQLAAARRWEAEQFQSGVFLSQPDGTWRFAPWPRIAQIAPIMALVVDDVNGDGFADVIAGQNDHSPIDLVGRFDGGLGQVLLGDGQGGFTALDPTESGFVVPGAVKSLTLVDVDGDGRAEIWVTRNNAPAMLFQR
ncbi:VCBS repeat-containing protein [Actomonas aquatica]|uniref:VCBS repeat-containing protein n=1 Tax=Actomonas aquatica TaxID=2866162 RepID=A0ABZ1C5D5_9BACT|nr:VCBS repeat-containing protein [Opitutus sp. WL0086]WRQ86824.1 VCBS repeat-containing protein [Opitutus sp. WL0086]